MVGTAREAELAGRGHGAVQVLGDLLGVGDRLIAVLAQVLDHDREVVVAHPRHRVFLAQRGAQALGDLDGFKAVNDRYGHDAGDALLLTVARRMKASLRTQDTIARMGGDEFIAVIGELDSHDEIRRPMARLLAALAEPVELEQGTVRVAGSIGVSFYPQAGPIEPEQLIRQADQAMYAVKQAGKNGYRIFTDATPPSRP